MLETKVMAVGKERGGWDIQFEGRITPRDMNTLKRGLKFAFGRFLRQTRLKRIAERSVVELNSELNSKPNSETKVEVPKLTPIKEPVDTSRHEG